MADEAGAAITGRKAGLYVGFQVSPANRLGDRRQIEHEFSNDVGRLEGKRLVTHGRKLGRFTKRVQRQAVGGRVLSLTDSRSRLDSRRDARSH